MNYTSSRQNTAQALILRGLQRFKHLRFCYFMAFLIFIGCKQQSNQDVQNQNQETTEQDSQNNSAQEEGSGTILFFGDSITAGYGLDDTDDAFPGLIQQKIDSLGMGYEVVNSGVSGETTAGGKSRIDWVMNQNVDIF